MKLGGDFNHAELATAVKVALVCLDYDPLARPSMGQVQAMLSGEMTPVNGSFANLNRVAVVNMPVAVEEGEEVRFAPSARLMGGFMESRF